MNNAAEKITNYMLLAGFLLFGTGIIASIVNQVRTGMPIEMAMILVGIALVILGLIAAKVFGEMP